METTQQGMVGAKITTPSASPDDRTAAGDDRIGGLCDDVLLRILGLVAEKNARYAVRTGVLSRRWRGLWTRVPALSFREPRSGFRSASDAERYITFIGNTLAQGARSQARFERLEISCRMVWRGLDSEEQLVRPCIEAAGQWIRQAVQGDVRCFFLRLTLPIDNDGNAIDGETHVIVLDDLPSSGKLETMHLQLNYVARVRLPSAVVFASLQDLALRCMRLAPGTGPLLSRLVSAACCPRLRKLSLCNINFEFAGQDDLVIEAGTLLELSLNLMMEMRSLELRTPNLVSLKIENCFKLEALLVSATGLEELAFWRNSWPAHIHWDLKCVRRLGIDLASHEFFDDHSFNDRDIHLLQSCSLATDILVHLYTPTTSAEVVVDLIKDKVPSLPHITTLDVLVYPMCERHTFGDGLASLLTRFNNLKYLTVRLNEGPGPLKPDEFLPEGACGRSYFACSHSDDWESSPISLAHLRKADFRCLTGTDCEIRFLRFVLSTATNLENVTISFSRKYNLESRKDDFQLMLRGDGTWISCQDSSERWHEWRP